MNKYLAGIISGFIATIVISILIILQSWLGIMSDFNVIKDMSMMLGATHTLAVGWILHFVLGTIIWGLLYAAVVHSMAGPHWFRGVIFSIVIWFLMMVLYMPVVGWGLFAYKLGFGVLIASVIIHIIYGFVLGFVYGLLRPEKQEPTI